MTFQIFIRLSTNVAKLRFLLYLQTMAPCQVKIQGNLFGVLITAEGADLSTMTKVSWVNETLTNWLHSFAFSNFGKLESFSPKERLPVVSPSVFRYGSFSGVASSQKGRRRFCHRTDGRQVWSLTQSYSVDSSQSRISVKKCVFSKRTIKVYISCFWQCPGTSAPSATHPLVTLYLCSSGSNAQGESRALERCRVRSKSPSRVQDGDEGVAGRNGRE